MLLTLTWRDFQHNENLDFLNYLDLYSESPDEEAIVKFSYKFDFSRRMSADIRLILMSDLTPTNYEISTNYALNSTFSVGLGSCLSKVYIAYFEQFHRKILTNYYLVDENEWQIEAYDLGFYLAPAARIVDNNRLKVSLQLNLGLASFLNESTAFYHKRKLSNERPIYYYHYFFHNSFLMHLYNSLLKN